MVGERGSRTGRSERLPDPTASRATRSEEGTEEAMSSAVAQLLCPATVSLRIFFLCGFGRNTFVFASLR